MTPACPRRRSATAASPSIRAPSAKRGLAAELVHLASTGLRHLLGYDHGGEDERVMNARAAALRREGPRRGRVRAA